MSALEALDALKRSVTHTMMAAEDRLAAFDALIPPEYAQKLTGASRETYEFVAHIIGTGIPVHWRRLSECEAWLDEHTVKASKWMRRHAE